MPLTRRPPQVYRQAKAADGANDVAGEEEGKLGDFGGLDQALDGGRFEHHPLNHLFLGIPEVLRLVLDLPLDQGRLHVGGPDQVGGDAMGADLEGGHLGTDQVGRALRSRSRPYRGS